MPTPVRLIKASNTPRDPQATDCSLLRGGGADAHLVDVLYKLRLAGKPRTLRERTFQVQ